MQTHGMDTRGGNGWTNDVFEQVRATAVRVSARAVTSHTGNVLLLMLREQVVSLFALRCC